MSGLGPVLRRAPVFGFFLLLYVTATYVGRSATPPDGQVSLTWPAAGVGVWFLWTVRGRPAMAAAVAAITVLNCAVNYHTGAALTASVAFGFINAVHGVIGALLVRRLVPVGLRDPADVGRLLAACTAVGSLSGAASAVLGALMLATPLADGLLLFIVRNAGTTFVVMAAVLAVSAPHRPRDLVARSRNAETALIAAAALVVCAVVVALPGQAPTLFLAASVSVWAGTRLGVPRAGALSLLTCVAAVVATVSGRGELAGVENVQLRAVLIQAFMVIMLLTAVSLATLRRANDELTSRLAASLDELRGTSERLRHLADHDTLTGLPNRGRLHSDLDAMLVRRDDRGVAVVFLDLDRFKVVNDTFGHGAGDRVLTDVARALRDCLRVDDLVGRFGGDEFVVVCDGVGDEAEVHGLCARLATAVAPALLVDGRDVGLGVSMGAVLALPGDDASTLLQRSDMAMYRMKRARAVPAAVTA